MATRKPTYASRLLLAGLAIAPLLAWLPGSTAAAHPNHVRRPEVQPPYTLEVLVDGRPLQPLAGRGRTYIEAVAGREYSLRFSNRTDRRVAVAVSVDGLNSIDAQTTTAGEGSKWIVEPRQTITLDGWQTSSDVARRFFFTTETASYGAWLGKTDNLGVISAVVFRERLPERVGRLYSEPKAHPKPAARQPAGDAAAGSEVQGVPVPPAEADPGLSEEYAATGIGREVDHRVTRIHFDSEATAAARLELRYEYRDALVKLGVLPRHRPAHPLDRRERARGFEDSGFAPDPYRQPRPL